MNIWDIQDNWNEQRRVAKPASAKTPALGRGGPQNPYSADVDILTTKPPKGGFPVAGAGSSNIGYLLSTIADDAGISLDDPADSALAQTLFSSMGPALTRQQGIGDRSRDVLDEAELAGEYGLKQQLLANKGAAATARIQANAGSGTMPPMDTKSLIEQIKAVLGPPPGSNAALPASPEEGPSEAEREAMQTTEQLKRIKKNKKLLDSLFEELMGS